jgi:hypothetical protein
LGEWNYETVDIAPFCNVGANTLALRVLRYSAHFSGNMSLVRAIKPGVIVHSDTLVSSIFAYILLFGANREA